MPWPAVAVGRAREAEDAHVKRGGDGSPHNASLMSLATAPERVSWPGPVWWAQGEPGWGRVVPVSWAILPRARPPPACGHRRCVGSPVRRAPQGLLACCAPKL